MSHEYNVFERSIARFLSRIPAVKKIAKKIYGDVSYVLNKKKEKKYSVFNVNSIKQGNAETFFGYYDKCPDNGLGLVLVNISSSDTRHNPNPHKPIGVNIYSTIENKFLLESNIETNSYNWQQGCRAHWLSESEFIYNNYNLDDDAYYSYIFSVEVKRVVKKIKGAVQDSFKNSYFLSINYDRLAQLRPDYGYFNKIKKVDVLDLENDGVWKYSFQDDSLILLVSLDKVCNFEFTKSANDFKHKINHVMISPDGEYFIFMHRFYDDKNQRFDRLILSDNLGNLLAVLADHDMVSHCFWYDNNSIIGYLRSSEGKDSYWLIDIRTQAWTLVNSDVFSGQGDGHPSVCGDYIITDTYPNKARMSALYLTRKKSEKKIKLGEFFHGGAFYGETRCDLHPRFSKDGDYVFFDSVYSGRRGLYYMKINDAKVEFDSD